MTDYLEELLELLEEPEEGETSVTAQAAWDPQTGTAGHSRARRLEKSARRGKTAPVPAGQEGLEAGGRVWGRNVPAPDPQQNVQTPDSERAIQTPGSERSVQAPDSRPDTQTPDLKQAIQKPDPKWAVQAPGSERTIQAPNSKWCVQAPGSERDARIPNPERAAQIPGLERRIPRRTFQGGRNGDRRWKLFSPGMREKFASGMEEAFTAGTADALLYGTRDAPFYGKEGAASYGTEDSAMAGAVDTPHYGAGRLPLRAVEEAVDALSRGGCAPSQWDGTQLSGAYWDAAPVQRTAAAFGSAAAMLERRLAQGMAWMAAPRAPSTAAAQDVTGTELDLEELDQRVRRDARRYDGMLTPY